MPGYRGVFQAVLLLFIALLLASSVASAQQLPANLPPGLIEQLNRVAPNALANPAAPLLSPLDQARQRQGERQNNTTATAPALPPPAPPSQLELDYSHRAGQKLTQYGYDIFRSIAPSLGDLQNGAVADDYRLNIGDQLVITLRGQVSRSMTTRIDREGHVVLPDLPPIAAAGRTFAEFRADLERQVKAAFLNTEVFVSVGTVRQVSVGVFGEVEAPGIFPLGGFSTALDALAMAHGIKKTGSLRHIMIYRGSQVRNIDLYDVMAGIGTQPDLSIADGDRIVVPTIGPTVAVAGAVDRPGIFELTRNGPIGGTQLLTLAGRPLRPDGNRFIRLALDQSGQDATSEVLSVARQSYRPGDIMMVVHRDDGPVGSVYLDGHVSVPGVRSLVAARDVRTLIGSSLLPGPYLPFGVIQRTDPRTQARVLVPVNLEAVMNGRQTVPLQARDVVIVLGIDDVKYLLSADVQAVLAGREPPSAALVLLSSQTPNANSIYGVGSGTNTQPAATAQTAASSAASIAALPKFSNEQIAEAQRLAIGRTNATVTGEGGATPESPVLCAGLESLAAVVSTGRDGRFANAVITAANGANATDVTLNTRLQNVLPCPSVYDKYPELLPLAIEHVAAVVGEVRRPGVYPVISGTPLASLVANAGDLAHEVDLHSVEITHFSIDNAAGTAQAKRENVQLTLADLAKVAVGPGDVIRFNPVYTARDSGPVVLGGEFRRPGEYEIQRGDRLSQLIARAGGLTPQAYPYGAVFTRLSVQAAEKVQLNHAAQELQSGLSVALAHASSSTDQASLVAATQQFATDLKATQPVGRVVVEADPTVLQVKPQLDIVMEPGDTVIMPKRPSYVTVTGEVLNPTALQFKPGSTPKDYIAQAGGLTQSAEDDSIFVVLPNGEAEPVKTSFWNYTPVQVPPGSVVVVPKDLKPFDLASFLRDSTGIFSQLAISAASLAVLHENSSTR